MIELLHLMTATIRDYDGAVDWHVHCPHDGKGDDRDCKWGGDLAPDCLWDLRDVGAHHPDCPEQASDCERASEAAGGTAWGCWWGREPPQCNGFQGIDGHCHPVDGVCGVRESLDIGFGDAIAWAKDADGHPISDGPIAVRVTWEDGICVLSPVTEPDPDTQWRRCWACGERVRGPDGGLCGHARSEPEAQS